MHVVVRVGHGPVPPRIGDTRYRGGVANPRLVVTVVGAPKADPLAQQIGLLVVVFGRADEVQAIRPTGLAQLFHLGSDFIQGLIPRNAFVLAIDQFHWIAQAVLAVPVLAQGRAFGTVSA